MIDKKQARLRRAKKTRAKISELGRTRLSVFKSNKHIYAQILNQSGEKVLASASTGEKDFAQSITSNVAAATKVGELIATRAKAVGVEEVAFDRSGFKYHGRVKALAEAARENGLQF